MRIHQSLIRWHMSHLLTVNVVAAVIGVSWALLHEDRLTFQIESWMGLMVPLHCLAIVWCLGQTSSSGFRFLYSQGFSRDALWGHTVLASVLSVAVAWIPIGLTVFLPIRSTVQDAMGNPWFPFAAWTERPWVWNWLLVYAVLLPLFHYAWIRSSLPRRGLVTGFFLAAAGTVAAFVVWSDLSAWHGHVTTLANLGLVAAAIALLVSGWQIHRRSEVQR